MSWLNSLLVALTSVQPHMVPMTVIGIVTVAGLFFIGLYLLRAVNIVNNLKKHTQAINGLTKQPPEEQLNQLNSLFQKAELKHAWREFEESLHRQKKVVDGEERISSIRSTSPSANYFSEQQLVDIPLNTEFFKHLSEIPGIGPITAGALVASIGDARHFANGRQLAA